MQSLFRKKSGIIRRVSKEILTVKANVDLILGVKPEEVKREKSQER